MRALVPAAVLASALFAARAVASPFAGCTGQQSDDATFFSCGNILASAVEFAEALKADEVEANLAQFEGHFPASMKRTRGTVSYGGRRCARTLVEGPNGRAQMVVVPLAKGARVVTCTRRGPADGPEKCDAMIEALATKGPPKGEKSPPGK